MRGRRQSTTRWLSRCPIAGDGRNDEDKVKWLLQPSDRIFPTRNKSAWWEYFRVHELEHEELLDERKAITGLQFSFVLPKGKAKENATHWYTYPPQEIGDCRRGRCAHRGKRRKHGVGIVDLT